MGEPMEEKSLKEFVEVLCSAAPVPGGGALRRWWEPSAARWAEWSEA